MSLLWRRSLALAPLRANSGMRENIVVIPTRKNRDSYAVLKALSSVIDKRSMRDNHDLHLRPLRFIGPKKQMQLEEAGRRVAKWYVGRHPFHFHYHLGENKNMAPANLYDSKKSHHDNFRDALHRKNPQRAKFYFDQLEKGLPNSEVVDDTSRAEYLALLSFFEVEEDYDAIAKRAGDPTLSYIFLLLSASFNKKPDLVEKYFRLVRDSPRVPTVVHNARLAALLESAQGIGQVISLSDKFLGEMLRSRVMVNVGTLNAMLWAISNLRTVDVSAIDCALSLIAQFESLAIRCADMSTLANLMRISLRCPNLHRYAVTRDNLATFLTRNLTPRQFLMRDEADSQFVSLALETAFLLRSFPLVKSVFELFLHGTNSYFVYDDFENSYGHFALNYLNMLIHRGPLDILLDTMEFLDKRSFLPNEINRRVLFRRILTEKAGHLLPRVFYIAHRKDRLFSADTIDCMQQVKNPSAELKEQFGRCAERCIEVFGSVSSTRMINTPRMMECLIRLLSQSGRTKYLSALLAVYREHGGDETFVHSFIQ